MKIKLLFSQKGAALITVLGFSAVIIALLQSVLFDSKAEFITAQHKLNELRARYSARAGIEVSLLRTLVYREAQNLLDAANASQLARSYLDLLWNFPLIWPLPVSDNLSEIEKKEIETVLNESFLKTGYNSLITPEDGKIDLNDLSSPIPHLQQFTFDTTLQLLTVSVEEKKELKEKYQPDDLLEIVNNLADWTDRDNQSRNGGDESLVLENHSPLNRSFVSLEEIQKVPGVTEDIYNILKPHITVYGSKGLNLNYTSPEVLEALNFSDSVMEIILSRILKESPDYSPFSTRKEFCDFMKNQALDVCGTIETRYKTNEMLQFNTVLHFRIHSLGESKESVLETETLVFDAYRLSGYYKKAVETHQKLTEPQPSETFHQAENKETNSQQSDSEKIHYNSAFPLFIMYWKENF